MVDNNTNRQYSSLSSNVDLHNGVEDRQAKQQLMECALIGAPIKEVGAGEGVREVGAK